MTVYFGHLDTAPLGRIWAAATDQAVVAVSLWDDPERLTSDVARLLGETPRRSATTQGLLAATLAQLEAYLSGKLREFDVPIDWSVMTPFRRQALELVCVVPYGRTSSYQAIAAAMGKPGSVRAVGQANATNPIPIIIPCHRVLGSDGKLHGYGARGGLETKAWLLRLEGAWLL